jgi:hypothetical protein
MRALVMMTSNRDGEGPVTIAASEKVLGVCPAPDRGQRRSLFQHDPATGTLIVSPDLDLKIRKALMAEAKRIQHGLFLRYLRLQVEKLALQSRSALLILIIKLRGVFVKLLPNRHG